jgi:hypothetical protein
VKLFTQSWVPRALFFDSAHSLSAASVFGIFLCFDVDPFSNFSFENAPLIQYQIAPTRKITLSFHLFFEQDKEICVKLPFCPSKQTINFL